jgi:Polyketide cyclase / dehydrase and lipid transport
MAEQREDKGGLAEALPTDALKEAGQHLLGLLVQRATDAAAQRVSGLADRLTDVTASGGDVRAAMNGTRDKGSDDEDERDQGDQPGVLARAWGSVTEKVKDVFGGGGGGGGGAKKLKMTNIVESIDIGLPLRTTYDLWTQFEDFPSFMKKVETVEQASDEKTNWTAKIFWSRRTWEATTVEQVPDSHIVWRSTGAKGHVDGAVTFTEIGPNSTRVLLVMEYWPKGLFEHTGNLWRAQGRRARLEFKHFRRHAMTNAILHQDELEGWRGEIRDSEVVTTHEDAIAAEQESAEEPVAEDEAVEDEAAQDETGLDDVADEDAEDLDADEFDDEEYGEADETYADDAEEYDEVDDDADEPADQVPARSGSRS